MTKELVDKLCNLTLQHQLNWKSIDQLNVNGIPYSNHFQHILGQQSFFTKYENKVIIVLYGEVTDWVDHHKIRHYYLQELTDNTPVTIEAPVRDIAKLHTLIQIV